MSTFLADLLKLSGLKQVSEADHPVPPEEVSPILFAKGKSFKGMDPDVAQRFKDAAAEYYAITGKRPTVTSAHRSKEWNDELIRAWDSGQGAKYGLVRRPSETSAHISGKSIDSTDAAEMEQLGILTKHGLYRPDPEGDYVHISPISRDDEQNPIQVAKKVATNTDNLTKPTTVPRSEPGPRGVPKTGVTPIEPTPFDTTPPIPVKSVSTNELKPKGQPDMDKLEQFARLNNIRDVTKTIHPGDVFKLPDGSTYTVQAGDNMWNMANMKLKGTPMPSTPSRPLPSTVTPDTEKPVKTPDVTLDPAEIAAQNKADMEYLRSQGAEVIDPNEFPDAELGNMRDRMLQNLPKTEPNIPEPKNDRLDTLYKLTDPFGGEEKLSPLTGTAAGNPTGSFGGDMRNIGIDVTPPKPGEPSFNKNKPETGGELPKDSSPDKFKQFMKQNLPTGAYDALKNLGNAEDEYIVEPIKKGLGNLLQPKEESTEINNIRKLAGLRGN